MEAAFYIGGRAAGKVAVRRYHLNRDLKALRSVPPGYLREQCPKQRAQPMQRPWGRTMSGMLEEQEGPCCWSTVRGGERRRGWGRFCKAWWAAGEVLVFDPEEGQST